MTFRGHYENVNCCCFSSQDQVVMIDKFWFGLLQNLLLKKREKISGKGKFIPWMRTIGVIDSHAVPKCSRLSKSTVIYYVVPLFNFVQPRLTCLPFAICHFFLVFFIFCHIEMLLASLFWFPVTYILLS